MRIFVSGIRKLIRRPASWVTLILMAAMLLLIFLAVGATARQSATQPGGSEEDAAAALLFVTFPFAYEMVLAFILGFGGLLAVVYGAAIAGSEWTWGTLKAAVARGESRSWYVLTSFASIAALVGIGLVLSFAVGVGAAVVGAMAGQVELSGLDDASTLQRIPEMMARIWVALSAQAALGFAIATIARSQLAGIGVGIGVYFVGQFAGIFIPDIVKWLLFQAATESVPFGGTVSRGSGGPPPVLALNEAFAVVVVWFVASLLVASLFTERAEISG